MPITEQEIQTLLQKTAVEKTSRSGCCGLFSKKETRPSLALKGWENFARNRQLPQALVIDIENKEMLQRLMLAIKQLNSLKPPRERIIMRAAAGGKKDKQGKKKPYSESFSFTPCVDADLIVHLVGAEFQEISLVDADNKIVRVGAGVQIGELDQALYEGLALAKKNNKIRLSLPTSSLIPHVTFVGLADNAGHGTGIHQPSVSGLIRALILCRPDGEIVRLDENDPNFATIKACFFSLYGIVLQVEIECMPAKKLECLAEARTMADFIEEIENGLIQKSSYLSVMYIPTYDETSQQASKNVLVEKWEPVSLDQKNLNNPTALSRFGQALSIKLSQALSVGTQLSKHPQLIPTYMRDLVAKIEVGTKDSLSIGPLPDIAHYQTAFPRNIDDSDYLFSFKPDNRKVTQALQKVVTLLNHYAEKGQFPVIDAIYLRFFKGTNGGLSSSAHAEDELICAFDIVSDPSIPGYAEFKKEVGAFFINELQARPHWGKTVPPEVNYAALYGKGYEDFMQALEGWHEHCKVPLEKSPFLNGFFCNILHLPFVPKLGLEEEQKEKEEAAVIFMEEPAVVRFHY